MTTPYKEAIAAKNKETKAKNQKVMARRASVEQLLAMAVEQMDKVLAVYASNDVVQLKVEMQELKAVRMMSKLKLGSK